MTLWDRTWVTRRKLAATGRWAWSAVPWVLHKDRANTVLSLVALGVSLLTLYLTYFHVERSVLVRVTSLSSTYWGVSVGYTLLNSGNRDAVILSAALEQDFPTTSNVMSFGLEGLTSPLAAPDPSEVKDSVIAAGSIMGHAAGGLGPGKNGFGHGRPVPGSKSGEREGYNYFLRLKIMDDRARVYDTRHFVGEVAYRPATPEERAKHAQGWHVGEYVTTSVYPYERSFDAMSSAAETAPPRGWVGLKKETQPHAARPTP